MKWKGFYLRITFHHQKELIFSDDFLICGVANIGIEVFKDLIQLRDKDKFNEMIEKAKTLGFKIPDIKIPRNDTIDVQNKIMPIDLRNGKERIEDK